MNTDSEQKTEALVEILRRLVSESDEFLQAAAGESTVQVREARARLQVTLDHCKSAYRRMGELGMAGARKTDETIREHPYESLGIAFGLGLLLGVLVARRD